MFAKERGKSVFLVYLSSSISLNVGKSYRADYAFIIFFKYQGLRTDHNYETSPLYPAEAGNMQQLSLGILLDVVMLTKMYRRAYDANR